MKNLLLDFFKHTPILLWAAICILALGVEEVCRKDRARAAQGRLHGKFLNAVSGIVTCAAIFIVTPLSSILVFSIGNRFGLGLIDLRFFPHYDLLSQILSALMLMFVEDFLYYFYHRAAHTFPFLWDIHAVHHSTTEVNVTMTLRRHWLETPLQEIAVAIPLALFFRLTHIEMSIIAFGRAAFVFFAHMNVPLEMRWCSWLLTSPQLHRLHHSLQRKHWDSNYAQVFPVIDRMFGTYVAPEKGEFPPTGLSSGERLETVSDILFWPFKKWARRFLA